MLNKQSGQEIDYVARLLEGPAVGHYHLEHSHVARPTEGAGFWHSGSHTSPSSVSEADSLVQSWAMTLETAFEVKPW